MQNEQFTVLYLYKGNETKVIDWLGETPQIGSIIAVNEVYYKVHGVQYRLVENSIFELKISARDKDEDLVYKSVQDEIETEERALHFFRHVQPLLNSGHSLETAYQLMYK